MYNIEIPSMEEVVEHHRVDYFIYIDVIHAKEYPNKKGTHMQTISLFHGTFKAFLCVFVPSIRYRYS